MTKEQAIKYLRIMKDCAVGDDSVIELKQQALDMAIEALSNTPNALECNKSVLEDCIYRSEVIAMLVLHPLYEDKGDFASLIDNLCEEVRRLPSVQPTQKGNEYMTVEEYRRRLMDLFHETDHDELIAFVSLPTEADFRQTKTLLEMYKFEPAQKWIKCEDMQAEIPCLACDVYNQIFIPKAVIASNEKCYDAENYKIGDDIEEFLKGKEIEKGLRLLPREIIAWMPLPSSYKGE